MTKRRALLRCGALAAAAAVAGCLGGADEPAGGGDDGGSAEDGTSTPDERATDDAGTDGPTTDGTGGPTTDGTDGLPGDTGTDDAGGTRPRGTGGPGVTLLGTDESTGPLDHRVEVVTEAATDETPPLLRVTVTNGSDRSVRVGEARALVFAYRDDTERHLTLLPADGTYPAEAGCWRLAEPIATTDEYRTLALAPGEHTERTLALYGAAGREACLPVGTFRFETTYRVAPTTDDADAAPTEGERVEHTWGFSVGLE
jgi:hypothetical protein